MFRQKVSLEYIIFEKDLASEQFHKYIILLKYK